MNIFGSLNQSFNVFKDIKIFLKQGHFVLIYAHQLTSIICKWSNIELISIVSILSSFVMLMIGFGHETIVCQTK